LIKLFVGQLEKKVHTILIAAIASQLDFVVSHENVQKYFENRHKTFVTQNFCLCTYMW